MEQNTLKRYALFAGSLIALLALSACGSLSPVTSQGTTNAPVWPNPANVTFNNGSYPNLDSLRLIGDGMTKDQIYNLLGRPHFNEGFAGVHEWNYLFHFRTAEGIRTCQYKILFDKAMLARSFLWHPEDCADVLNQPQPATFSLSSDVLFAFDSSRLTSSGQAAVADVAQKLRSYSGKTITVTGYTDRIGSDTYNQTLSERRAQAVSQALTQNGISASRIRSVGMGESNPVVQCQDTSRQALIDCLAPNRRVTITTN